MEFMKTKESVCIHAWAWGWACSVCVMDRRVIIYPVIVTPQIWPYFAQDNSIQCLSWRYKPQKILTIAYIRYKRKLWLHRHIHTCARFPLPFERQKKHFAQQFLAPAIQKNMLDFTRMQACFFNHRKNKSHCTAVFLPSHLTLFCNLSV